MRQPWRNAGETDTKEGRLQVKRRGDHDVVLLLDGRVLQSNQSHPPEADLVQFIVERMKAKERPQFLLAGVGLGFGLRTALELLPERAQIAVFEPNPDLLRWARGPLEDLTGRWLDDPRVTVVDDDITTLLHNAARAGGRDRFDAIAFDAYTGVAHRLHRARDPWFGKGTLQWAHGALYKDGVIGLWSEETEFRLESRFRRHNYRFEVIRPRRKGPDFVVYLANPVAEPKRRDESSESSQNAKPVETGGASDPEAVSGAPTGDPSNETEAAPAPPLEEDVIVGSRHTSRQIPRGRPPKTGRTGSKRTDSRRTPQRGSKRSPKRPPKR